MGIVFLKVILLIVMAIVAFLAGTVPIKLYEFLKKRSRAGGHSSLIVSLLSCFAGGVILGVCLLDMLPDAQEDAKILRKYEIWDDYPFLELFIGIGFFIVYFMEEVIDKFCIHDHEIDRERRMTVTFIPEQIHPEGNLPNSSSGKRLDYGTTGGKSPDYDSGSSSPSTPEYGSATSNRPLAGTVCSVDKMEEQDPLEKRKAMVSAFTLVLALLIHTFLEGFAFGVQDSEVSVTSLFFGIIVHKALVMFSVGMNLTEKLPDRKLLILIFVFILSLVSPLGGSVGLVIEGSDIPEKPKAIVVTILTCFSIGCFFFITFFDILAVERKNQHNNLLQWIACIFGFICVALMILLAGHDEKSIDPTSCPPGAIVSTAQSQ
ncbi:hypothetical protein FO519_003935 [Halicephalobus sp. NKZ332]|nr:hypothetical protein FO519_003935 [Halicephalobus sp. NKZ332]